MDVDVEARFLRARHLRLRDAARTAVLQQALGQAGERVQARMAVAERGGVDGQVLGDDLAQIGVLVESDPARARAFRGLDERGFRAMCALSVLIRENPRPTVLLQQVRHAR